MCVYICKDLYYKCMYIYIYANIRHKYKYDIYMCIYIYFLMQQFELDQKCLSSTSGIQAGLELILFK